MNKGIKNRGSQVHHVKRGDLLAKEHAKEIIEVEDELYFLGQDISKLSQKQRSQLRSYGN